MSEPMDDLDAAQEDVEWEEEDWDGDEDYYPAWDEDE